MHKHPKAVLVNDDPVQLMIVSQIIGKEHLDVAPFESAHAALQYMRPDTVPDLLITDLNMPGIDGWRLSALMRSPEYPHLNRVPILVLSATFSGAEARDISRQVGANDFLGVPFSGNLLRDHVRALLAGQTPTHTPLMLIVEDSPVQTRTLKKAAEQNGYAVRVAATADAARTLLRRHRPDVALLDYHLPGASGEELIKDLTQPNSRTVVIMITADPTPQLASRWMTLGADAYLRKPFHFPYLLQLVERAKRSRALLGVTNLLETRTRQLHRAQRMEAVGQLAGGVAHDFNNLLTGILGYASLLKHDTPPGTPVHDAAGTIEKAAERASQLTAQLLGFAGNTKPAGTLVNLHETIAEVVRLLARTIDKNINLRQNLAADPSIIISDPGQMHQVLLNLALNASDAMPDGGDLTIAIKTLHISHDYSGIHPRPAAGPYLAVSVTDTGCGMSTELQKKVFDPFFTTKKLGNGVGMGLAMVYSIVRNHNGWVEVHSQEGRGTTFTIHLPLASDTAHIIAASPRPLVRGSGFILLVDDEEIIRNVGATMLARLGYTPVTAASAAEAIEAYRKQPRDIRLAIIDMVMPGTDGRRCFEALKAINPDVRAILSSGLGHNTRAQKALDQGMLGFIQKPYRLDCLANAIAAALHQPPPTPSP